MELSTCLEKDLSLTCALTTSSEIKSIAQGLMPFGIHHFCYLKLFTDGSHLLLCTDPEWVRCFYLHHYSRAAHHKDPKTYLSGLELWSTVPDQSTVNIAREQFNIAHGIAIIEQQGDECELYNFATTHDNSGINNFYLHNLDVLRHFILFFKEQAQPLIKKANADRFILPHWFTAKSPEIEVPFSSASIDNHYNMFWAATQVKRYSMGGPSDGYLTSREMTCMSLLGRGLSTKEIARKLDVAPRTIEAHFDNLRIRLQCGSKYELLARVVRKWPHWF